VYDTCPRDIKVLHLGYPSRYTIPENVTQVRVDRKDMPQWIGRCKVGIVPYWNQIDSGPRALVEMAACGLVSVVADELNFYREKYEHVLSDHDGFWDKVRFRIALDGDRVRRKPQNTGVEYCANNLMFYTAT
jgi:glycosyltransferase involved in cell wall biosynthesis